MRTRLTVSPAALVLAAVLLAASPAPKPAAAGAWGSDFTYTPVIRPYSYYAAIPPVSPRGYVGYVNPSDSGFAFYGRPYGHPYDRWSWDALSTAPYGGVLAKYYYPPVR
ncbi:MAG: hypothetical protein U0835_02645 [Isosphaeraceae bacterium]